MLRWMPLHSDGASCPIAIVTAAPQSPPCAIQRRYSNLCINSVQACAIRSTPHPVAPGLAEKP